MDDIQHFAKLIKKTKFAMIKESLQSMFKSSSKDAKKSNPSQEPGVQAADTKSSTRKHGM